MQQYNCLIVEDEPLGSRSVAGLCQAGSVFDASGYLRRRHLCYGKAAAGKNRSHIP